MNKASERVARYDAKNTTRVYIKLNNKTDRELIEKLNKAPSKQGYIRRLIREDIAKENDSED